MKIKILSVVLFLTVIAVSVAGAIIPNPIISRGKTVYTSSGITPILVDNNFGGTSWGVSNGSWIAINLGMGPTKVFFNWNNPNYSWSDVLASAHSCKQAITCPVNYVIQKSSNSTNGSDGTWTTMATITGNNVTARGHLIDFSGASWIKMSITTGGGFINEVEVFDASNSADDIWFFAGTSISANAFKSMPPAQNFADLVAQAHPGYNPAMIRGGIPCIFSGDLAGDVSKYIAATQDVKYWAIEMGTNDAWGGSNGNVASYKSNLQTVITACKAAGIQPIISRMIGTNQAAAGWQVHPDYLKAIDDLTTQNNLIAGPDFYTWFSTHPGDLGSDGVHPNASGAASMQKLWADKMSSLYVGVVIPVTGVTLLPASVTITPGATSALTATILPSNASNKNVTWHSSDATIATISSTGLVTSTITGVAAGTATITVTTIDGAKIATCVVTVQTGNVPVTGVSVLPATVTIAPGATSQLAATVLPTNATNKNVNWSTSSASVATVNSMGLVTGVAAGTATITTTTLDGAKTAISTITVSACTPTPIVPYVQINTSAWTQTSSVTAAVGNSVKFGPQPVSGGSWSWSGPNGFSATTREITITNIQTTQAGNYVATYTNATGCKSTNIFTIIMGDGPITGVSVTPTVGSIGVGTTMQLTATVVPLNAVNKAVIWTSSNNSVATISATGLVTGIGTGNALITVTTQDGNFTATCAVTVTGGTPSCAFGAPLATALPTISKAYNYVYVLGPGPSFANVSNMTINWDLANKGLYQLSMSTKDGKPNWYVDQRAMATQTFVSAQPSITFSGTGFPGLDGSYYVAIDNGNFVLAEKSGAYTIYFSNSAISPVCTKSGEGLMDMAAEDKITVFPNPSLDGNFMVRMIMLKDADLTVSIFNQVGQKIFIKALGKYGAGNNEIQLQTGVTSGIYFMEIKIGNIVKHAKLEIR